MVRYFPSDADRTLDSLPRILSRADALSAGLSPRAIDHRLQTGRWQLVLPHTYLTSNVMTWLDRQNAALTYAGTGALLTSAAALADVGLRTVTRPRRISVLAPHTATSSDRLWVAIRRTHRMPERAMFPGPARAAFARSVADLALERSYLDDVRALVAQAVRTRLCTVDELAVQLAEGPRRNSKNLRLALEEIGAGAWSAPEARAARILRAAQVPPFEQNGRIDLPDGSYLIVDFVWRELRAILEIDSVEHHFLTPAQRDATDERHLRLLTAGQAVTHRTPWLVFNQPDRFVRGIESWLAARARELTGR